MFPHSTVTFRRLPTLWASLRPRSPRSSKTSAHSQPASSLWKLETVLPQASLDLQQDIGPCRKKLVVPLLPGPMTQVCDENSKQAQMMKTRVALFSHASHARKIVLAFSLEENFQVKCKSDSMSARVVFTTSQLIANNSGSKTRTLAYVIRSTVLFVPVQLHSLPATPSQRRLAMSCIALRLSGKSSTPDYARRSRTMMTLHRPSTYVLRLLTWLI